LATYDAANEQTTFSGATLQYDANGNLTSDGTNSYQWDARNRLIAISGSVTATFGYDVFGRRMNKTVNGVNTLFLYDRKDIVGEIGGGAVGATYLRSLSLDDAFIRQSATTNEHYHTDGLGSTLALSTGLGLAATTYAYEPFGKANVSGTSANTLQYTGRENDGTGLVYYRSRYYHPLLQRFIKEDPTRFDAGLNFYSYVQNNPLKFTDPLGLDVIIRYYPTGAYGATHVGIAVSPNGDDTVDTVAFGYPDSYVSDFDVLMGRDVPGAVINDAGRRRGDTIRIPRTPEQDRLAQQYIAARTANPGNYNLYGRNCALFVKGALQAAGIPVPNDPYDYIPYRLFNNIKQYDDNRQRWGQR
jgi:RHS repeat-associated protein